MINRVNRKVTHLVASTSRTRTHKVRQAAKYEHIKIVNQQWLLNSMSKWEKEDETPYLVSHTRHIGTKISLTFSRYKFMTRTRSEKRVSTPAHHLLFMTPTKALKIPLAKERKLIVFLPAKKK
jgi:hypothetical protein